MSRTDPRFAERRRLDCAELELRSLGKGGPPTICSYAAVFNSLSEDLGGFRETILPGAFARSLQRRDDVIATINHESDRLLGRVSSGTLTLQEDRKGLFFNVRPPDTTYARDLLASMKRGDISGASFGFIVDGRYGQRWKIRDGARFRQLVTVRLLDVSVVATPAYPDATAAARSQLAAREGLCR